MDIYFIVNLLRNITATFFQNGVWVIGFFFLLNKTYENEKLKEVSKYIVGICLILLFIYSVMVSI